MLRSVLAVVVGYIAMSAIVLGAFVIFGGLIGREQEARLPAWYLATNLIAAVAAGAAGGYVAAWIARRSEMRHALVLGVLSEILGIVSLVMYWGKEPLWYSLALLVIVLPAVLLGGYLRARGAAANPRPEP